MKRLQMDFPVLPFPEGEGFFLTVLPPHAGSRNASTFPSELPQRTLPDVSETSLGPCWCEVGEGGGCSF